MKATNMPREVYEAGPSPIHGLILPRIGGDEMNKSQVSAILARDPYAVTRAIVLLWSYQTPQERASKRTTDLNGKGFSVRHNQNTIAYWVRWVLRLSPSVNERDMTAAVARYLQNNPRQYRCLTGSYLVEAREVATYYWRQLAAAAVARATLVPDVSIQGSDMEHMLRQYDRFQVFPGLMQHA